MSFTFILIELRSGKSTYLTDELAKEWMESMELVLGHTRVWRGEEHMLVEAK
jgi:hypothetical protein